MPHYIPVVSRTEDLDDHRPAEEQTLQSKMLMKLKGTFKIRLFQGSDWHRASKTLPASADITTDTTALKASGEPSREEALSSSAAAATGKSVRFKKEDLLRDLTAPPVSGTSSGSRKQPGGNNGNGNGGSSSRSAISSRTGALKGTAHKSSRSSKPLFEVREKFHKII